MSLVFRPHRFKDKLGDVIEMNEMYVRIINCMRENVLQVRFMDDFDVFVIGVDDIQNEIERHWNNGYPIKAKNLSHELREKIRIFESLMESKGTEWTINEQLKLDMLREKLRKLQQEEKEK